MSETFAALTRALEGAPGLALGAALVWGVLSIVLSPCHLASIPLIVAFVSSQGATTVRRAFSLALAFALGILVTIVAIGAITAAAGRLMGDIGGWASYLVAALLILIGLHLLDVIRLPLQGGRGPSYRGRGLWAALILGLLFGAALGPCTFAYMAPMLAVTFRVAATAPAYALGLLLAFGVGHCAVIVLAGTSAELVQRYLNWTERSRGTTLLRRACAALVIVAGLYMLYAA